MVIRAMSPDIVAVDEIGGKKDIEAIESVIHCGCIVLVRCMGQTLKNVSETGTGCAAKTRGIWQIDCISGKNGAGTVQECLEL